MSEKTEHPTSIVPLRASDAIRDQASYDADRNRWATMIESGALPKHVGTAEQAITLARAGEVYGWDPIRALRSLFIVEGRVEMWAQDMLGLILERCPEASVDPQVMGSDRVVIVASRPPLFPSPVTFETTTEQFQHLVDDKRRRPWQHYRGDMLWARCISRIGRRMFPDITAGAYARGEIGEGDVHVRQVGPREVPMPGEAPTVEDAEVVGAPAADYEDCELCGGQDGNHNDPICPHRGAEGEYTSEVADGVAE